MFVPLRQPRHSILILLAAAAGVLAPNLAADAPPVTLTRDGAVLQWSADPPWNGQHHDAEYKDVQLVPDPASGNLLLYLPVTRPNGDHADTLMLWNGAAFDDVTAARYPIPPGPQRGTYDADFADVDVDGDPDIVYAGPHGNRLYLMGAGGVYSDATDERFTEFMRKDDEVV